MAFFVFSAVFIVTSFGNSYSPTQNEQCSNTLAPNSALESVFLGNGNDYQNSYATVNAINPICNGYQHLWEDPSIPYNKRNSIGRAIFQTEEKVLQAKQLITKGKSYNLGYNYRNNMALFEGTYFNLTTHLDDFQEGQGFVESSLFTNAIGNSGTQFDSPSHFYLRIRNSSDRIFFNNFLHSKIKTKTGFKYVSIDNYPTFFTVGYLLDIPKYLGKERLDNGYAITTEDILGTLNHQNLNLNQLIPGDVVIIYTGYAEQHWFNGPSGDFMTDSKQPGVTLQAMKDIFYPRGVSIIASDTYGVEVGATDYQCHPFWLVCAGGFLHEALKLDEIFQDLRDGKIAYKGAYVFQAMKNEGGCCSPGSPTMYF